MIITMVDSNVLLDVLTEDKRWFTFSSTSLSTCADEGSLVINPLIYAELSVGFATIEELESAVLSDVFHRIPLPWEAAFLAGKAFLRYRRSGGSKSSPLPDFFIGAHAAVGRFRLLTRDSARYRSYFPTVKSLAS